MPALNSRHNSAVQLLFGLIKLVRPKQWIKNAFVFAPLLFSGLFLNWLSVQQAIVVALLFCLASSATYILNDLKDIEKDRLHPTKSKTRPLASGVVQPIHAKFLMGTFYLILALAAIFYLHMMLVIAAYLLLNIVYSHYLKYQPVLDIFTIAAGFVLRVYAGAVAIAVPISSWMFITTLCLALYLASIKRRQELNLTGIASRKTLEQYSLSLLNRYAEMSAIGALLFYSIFVMSEKPSLIVSIPLVLFGIFRYWYITDIHHQGESPTDTLLYDKQMLTTAFLWVIVCIYGLWPV